MIWGRKLPRIQKEIKVNKNKKYYIFWASLGITFFISLIVTMTVIIYVMTEEKEAQDCPPTSTPSITIINQLPWDWKQATMPGTFPTITPLIPKEGGEGN